MELAGRISAFVQLGDKLRTLSKDEISELSRRSQPDNQWFTEANVARAIDGIARLLEEEKLKKWIARYQFRVEVPKIVGIVMAGNIPMVGFHDLLCVLVSGHFAAIKLSSQDSFLSKQVIQWLIEIEPKFKRSIEIREKLTGIDAVIATGSDNTSRYFEYYFSHIPRIIRKNRTSVAVLTGKETSDDLAELGKDIFWYFGLGCRNVSKLLIPKEYQPNQFFEAIESFSEIIHHNKYKNNYDYYRSIFLVNGTTHLDNGFLTWLPTKDLVSPVSVLYAEEYNSPAEVENYLKLHSEKIQCVIGADFIPFGQAQSPEVWDYADHVDTIEFLLKL